MDTEPSGLKRFIIDTGVKWVEPLLELQHDQDARYGRIVRTTISAGTLSLYAMAAKTTGFKLSVVAGPGEEFTFWHEARDNAGMHPREKEQSGFRTVIVQDGHLGINILKPVGEIDHARFGKEYERLRSEQNPQK